MAFQHVRFFRDICSDDVPLVGGKNAALGEMYRELGSQGIPVPNGFVSRPRVKMGCVIRG